MRLTIAEPFGIAGNFYYIGASDVAAFLLAGPEGLRVLDADLPAYDLLFGRSRYDSGYRVRNLIRTRASPSTTSSSDCRRTPRVPRTTEMVLLPRTISVPCSLPSSCSRK